MKADAGAQRVENGPGRSSVAPRAPIWLLVLIALSGTLAMHMFVPALPNAAQDLGASIQAMQMTISLYIMGLAFGQLIYGPLSDSLGRRPLLMGGLALYSMGGFAAAFAPDVHTLLAARLLQALGGCAGLVLGRAIVRDTARADEVVQKLALMNLMLMVGPGVAPLVGSVLTATLGWRYIFLLLAALGAVTLVLTWKLLPETGRGAGSVKAASFARDYRRLLRSPSFVGFALGGGCSTTSFYAIVAAAPFIFTTQLHRPLSEVGLYLGLLMVGISLGNVITSRLIRTVGIERLLIGGNAASVASACALLLVVLLGGLTVGFALGLMFVFTLGAGMSSPAALNKAISVDSTLTGSAAGLYGFTQMAVGALCTSLVGLGHNPALAAACVLAVAAILGQIAFRMALRKEQATRLAY